MNGRDLFLSKNEAVDSLLGFHSFIVHFVSSSSHLWLVIENTQSQTYISNIVYDSSISCNDANVIVSRNNDSERRFPDDFLFGVASAAYQIEGGWNADGKGPNIWDEFTHTQPERIVDRSNGDVGPNSYEYFADDIAAVKSLGVKFYSHSIRQS